MKKILIILTILIIPFVLTGCGPKGYDEVSFSELNKMIDNKENFVLVIGAETCSACKAFKPTMERVIQDYKLDIKYIDNDKLSESEYSDLLSNFYVTGTPTTVFVKKGKETDTDARIEGNEKYSKVVEKLKKQGYIKE